MEFHVKRTQTRNQEPLTQYRGLRSTRWFTPPSGKSVHEIQTTHTPTALQKIPEHLNYLTPPPHWHWYQDEYFYIKEGRYIFTLEGKTTTLSALDPQPVHIPAQARHTFQVDETHEGPCTIEITTSTSPRSAIGSPEAEGATSMFFRNIYSYLDDCYLQDVSPSMPQLLMMMDSAEISVAFPGPAVVARPVSYVFGVVFGRWLGWALGYRASYPEYWDEGGRKTK